MSPDAYELATRYTTIMEQWFFNTPEGDVQELRDGRGDLIRRNVWPAGRSPFFNMPTEEFRRLVGGDYCEVQVSNVRGEGGFTVWSGRPPESASP